MGMDVCGRNPISEEGNYFWANIFTWDYILTVMHAANIDVPHEWSFNEGQGPVTQDECSIIADKVEQFLEKDVTILYRESPKHRRIINALGPGAKACPPDTAKVSDWIRFLRTCGGFMVF
jgi:hypothetical protein